MARMPRAWQDRCEFTWRVAVAQFAYDAAYDLLTLTDRKTNATRWNYDKFGYATNKIDAASNTVFGKSDSDKWSSRGGCAGKQP